MIENGWLDWAIKLPGPLNKTYAGTNQAKGIFLHSAEGYKATLLRLVSRGDHSWHFSNMLDGQFYQHYPISARCWHASAANFDYLGCENEGIGDPNLGRPEPSLSEFQIVNSVRLIKEVSNYKGWKPTRPYGTLDKSHTLWEHNEVTRIGGSATACPSGRIPWNTIFERLKKEMPDKTDEILALLALAHFIRNDWRLTDLSDFDIAAINQAVERMNRENANP